MDGLDEKEPRIASDGRVLRGVLRMLPVALVFWALFAFLIWLF